jgi:uncharacterized membrane protein YkvA (DUF1232 family)
MGSFFQKLKYYFLIFFDRQTPWYVKLMLIAGFMYILVPFDIVADTIPFLGWLDDLAVATFIVALAMRLVPKDVLSRVQRKMFGPYK